MSDFFTPDEPPAADGPPDFEIRILAADFAEGAAGPVTEADHAHIRNVVKGFLSQVDAILPIGWSAHVNELSLAANQTIFTGNPRKTMPAPELPPDRLERVEEAICGGIRLDGEICGQPITSQGDDVWVHVQMCIEPEPAETAAS